MGNRVQRVRTEVSEPQMAQAIIEAWKDMFGTVPFKEQVALVLAQNSLETGSRKSMWNYNIGNITTNGKDSYDYFDDLKTDEQISPGVWKKMNLKYRAYPTLKDGAKDYLKLLSGKHYSNAWEHIKNPDPAAFSKALKQSGYYTANEAPYTKTLSSLFGKYTKSNAYETARSGKVEPIKDINMPKKDDLIERYLAHQKSTGYDPYEQLIGHDVSSKTFNGLDSILNNFLKQIAASEKLNKKLYKKYLPSNNLVIRISADYNNAIEFSRILCTALNEELLADANTHSDDHLVEVECNIHGPSQDCFDAVQQLTDAIASAFQTATVKIGGIKIKTQVSMNKKSSYEQISVKTATNQYRKFLLKFI